MTRFLAGAALGALAAALMMLVVSAPRPAEAADTRPADTAAQIEQLRAEIKKLQDLVPDQAAVMSRLSYHWGNLWFAVAEGNWPLADFYLGETRNNLKWAVRTKPIRKDSAGKIVDLGSIAQALDNAQFTDLKKAIDAKDRARCVKLYDEALTGCYACHKASEKPYLRPQRPTAAETRIINFDPNAKTPE